MSVFCQFCHDIKNLSWVYWHCGAVNVITRCKPNAESAISCVHVWTYEPHFKAKKLSNLYDNSVLCFLKSSPPTSHSKKKLHGLSPQANYTDRPPLVGEVIANFCG
jgi:hypothetical protein